MEENKTPLEAVNELADMLIKMEAEGLIHENHTLEIEEVMAAIYSRENIACNLANGNHDPDDDEYCPTNSPYILIEFVENKAQFAEDYKNAINQTIRSGEYIRDANEAAQNIINQRGT